jgi:hypothetical protein
VTWAALDALEPFELWSETDRVIRLAAAQRGRS